MSGRRLRWWRPGLLLGLPLAWRELSGWAGQRRLYTLRTLAVLALVAVAGQAIASHLGYRFVMMGFDDGQTWRRASHHLGLIGAGPGILVATTQALALLLMILAPGVGAGGVALLREGDGLDLVRLTRLGPARVVIELWLARVALLAAFLLLAAPLLGLALACGGLELGSLLFALAVLLLAAVLGPALALAAGAWARDGAGAIILAYLVVAAVWIGLPWATSQDRYGSWYGFQADAWRLPDGAGLAPLELIRFTRHPPWPQLVLTASVSLAATAIALAIAAWGLRRPMRRGPGLLAQWFTRLDRWFEERERGWRGFQARADLPRDRPLLWRSLRSRSLLGWRWMVRLLVPLVGVIVLAYCLTGSLSRRHDIRLAGEAWWTILTVGLCLLLAVRGAAGLAAMRADGSLAVLLATPMPARRIIAEHAAGLLRLHLAGLVPIALVLAMDAFMVQELARHRTWLLALDALLLPALAGWVGLAAGLRARSRQRAVIRALGWLLAWCIVGSLLACFGTEWLRRHDPFSSWCSGQHPAAMACWPGMHATALLSGMGGAIPAASHAVHFAFHSLVLGLLALLVRWRADRLLRG